MTGCLLCPRQCQALRTSENPGVCGVDLPPGIFRIGKIMAHLGEEPFISGTKGSGTVFFSGCALGCRFCQNYPISLRQKGKLISENELTARVEKLILSDVHNINWVTGSHFSNTLIPVIEALQNKGYHLPMIWNTSAYELNETLKSLEGYVQIYLPDFKYHSRELSQNMAQAPDYRDIATGAIREMLRQQPVAIFDEAGMMQRGVALRHLVLPGHYKDSISVIDWLSEQFPLDLPFSIMSQYTPFSELSKVNSNYPELNRRLTTYEYQKVIERAQNRGFSHILTQNRTSATKSWTPDFEGNQT